MKKLIPILIAMALTACTYSVYMTRYPHLKTARVTTFENRSTQYGLQEDLLDDLVENFERDRLVKVVEQDPDCVLEGVILDYENDIYNYDANDVVTQYKVKILFSVTLTDLVKNETLWSNEALLLEQVWQSQGEDSGIPDSEEGAQKEIFDDLYAKIKENTFESW